MYDLIILGGGPAGYRAAERAGHFGLKTLLIERRALGGVCLNEGCIPSKTLLQSAKIYDYTKGYGEKYGVKVTGSSLDHSFVIGRKEKVIKTLVSGIGALMKKHKVEVLYENADILGKDSDGFLVKAGSITYKSKNLLVATGSEALIPPIDGLKAQIDSGFVLTNREILSLKNLPKNLVIVGGGVIGLEMASYFNSAGVFVTVVEMLDKVAGPTDREISSILQANYEKKGIKFELSSKVTSFGKNSVTYEKNGKAFTINADYCLLSIGRRANISGFGLESLNVLCEKGSIVTDEFLKTNIPNLYAAGDVNGKWQLAHTAYREAEVAVNNIIGQKDRMNYNAIPSVIYTNPEVASIGETKESATNKGIEALEYTMPLKFSGRYLAENEGGDGISKLVIDKKTNKLIGVHMIGNPCSEIIWGVAPLIECQLPLSRIEKFVFPHPTVSEIIREQIFNI